MGHLAGQPGNAPRLVQTERSDEATSAVHPSQRGSPRSGGLQRQATLNIPWFLSTRSGAQRGINRDRARRRQVNPARPGVAEAHRPVRGGKIHVRQDRRVKRVARARRDLGDGVPSAASSVPFNPSGIHVQTRPVATAPPRRAARSHRTTVLGVNHRRCCVRRGRSHPGRELPSASMQLRLCPVG